MKHFGSFVAATNAGWSRLFGDGQKDPGTMSRFKQSCERWWEALRAGGKPDSDAIQKLRAQCIEDFCYVLHINKELRSIGIHPIGAPAAIDTEYKFPTVGQKR